MALLASVPQLDEILAPHAAALGRDLVGYRNHTYRVVNLCIALSDPSPEQLRKFAVAAAFHDLGIWTAATFDYIEPSVALAEAWLSDHHLAAWAEDIQSMIRFHHKLTRYRGTAAELVEVFRRADTIDVSLGLVGFGVPANFRRTLSRAFPNAGFHRSLVRLSLKRLRSHPLSPLPMYRV